MTEKMGDRVPQDLPPDSDTNTEVVQTKVQLVAEAKAAGIKVPSRATKADVQALLEANQADSGSDDTDQAADQAADEPSVGLFDDIDGVTEAADESDDTDEATEAADESDDTDEADVGLATDHDTDDTDGSDESDDTDEATEAADESDDTEAAPVVDLSHVPANGQPEDFEDADEQPVDLDSQPEWADEGVTPGSTVFVADDRVSLADKIKAPFRRINFGNGRAKAAFGRVNFGSRRTRVIIIGLVALLALIAAMVVVSLSTDDGTDGTVATPVVEVDDVFSGLCETEGEVDLTAMPVAGFSLDGLNADGTDDAATVQSRVVDDYFVDTSLGCSPQGIEFLRTGVDQARIDADRPGLDARDSAGRIAYYGENSEEALVVAEYLNKVTSECAAEMVVLSEADIQDGLYVLTFTDGSYGDLVWVKMPVETALSGVDSVEVMSCTIGLVEGSDGLTRSFMYSEGLGTFVSVETPFGNTVEYVPAPVEETGAEPVTVTDEPEAPEVNDTEAEAAEDEAETAEEPQDTSGEEAETAEKPDTTTEPETTPATDTPKTDDPPKADPPKADPPKADPPKADPPKADEPKADPPKADPPKADPPKADEPKADPPKAEPSDDTATETPAEDTEQTTDGQPETPAEDAAPAPATPVDAGDQGTIPGDSGCNGGCGGPNEDGSNGGVPGDAPSNGGSDGGCVGICVGQGGNDGGQDGCTSTCPGDGGGQGGCNVDCDGGDEPDDTPEPEETPEEDPEEVPEEDPQDECVAPNTLDSFGNCKAPPRGGAVDL